MVVIRNIWKIPINFHESKRKIPTKDAYNGLSEPEEGVHTEVTVQPLLDLTARAVGRIFTCRELEESGFTLDTLLLTKIGYYAFPQDFAHPLTLAYFSSKDNSEWYRAIRIIDFDQVQEVRQIGFMLIGQSTELAFKQVNAINVTITFEQQRITSCDCTACTESSVAACRHALAVIIYRIRFPDKVPIHPPITESIAAMNKYQLQRLIYRLMNDQSSGTLYRMIKYKERADTGLSKFNESFGFPDSTFGILLHKRTTWKLSLETLFENIKHDLINQNPTRYFEFVNTHIPQSKSQFWDRYMTKVLDLLSIGDVECAVQILVTIMESVTSVILDKRSANRYLLYASRFLYDIERQLCFCVVCYEEKWRNEILTAAARVNRLLSQCQWYMEREEKEPSQYYDIRTIKFTTETLERMGIKKNVYETLLNIFNPDGPMYQVPLCYLLPESLIQDSRDNLCSNDWPIEVLLFVFDLLVQWKWIYKERGSRDYQVDLLSLGTRILELTMQFSNQFSIMSCRRERDLDGVEGSQVEADEGSKDVAGASQMISVKRRCGDCEGTRPIKKMKYTDTQLDLSVGQVYCILLMVSQMIVTSSECQGTDFPMAPVVVKAFIRSVELERFVVKSHKDLINYKCRTLYRLTTSILGCLQTTFKREGQTSLPSVAAEYGKVILSHGLEFYDGNVPLHLINIIVSEESLELEERLELSYLVLTNSFSPLRDTVSLDINYTDYDLYGFRSKTIALKTFGVLLETLLHIGPCTEFMPKVLMAMDHVNKIADLHFLAMAFEVYENTMVKFSIPQKEKIVDLIMKFLHESFQVSQRRLHLTYDKMVKVLCRIFEDAEEHTTRSIFCNLEQVCQIFKRNQLKDLVQLSEKGASSSPELLETLTEELVAYLQSDVKHDVTSIELILMSQKNNAGRHVCIDEVLKHYGNYTSDCLFYLAQKEHEMRYLRVTRKQKLICDRVFDLIRAGFLKLTKKKDYSKMLRNIGSETDFLHFFTGVFAGKTEIAIAQKEQFAEFLNLLVESCELDTIASIIGPQAKSIKLTNFIKSVVGETLCHRISTIFYQTFSACSHVFYSDVLIKLLNTKEIFGKFVPNGNLRFTDLASSLSQNHKS